MEHFFFSRGFLSTANRMLRSVVVYIGLPSVEVLTGISRINQSLGFRYRGLYVIVKIVVRGDSGVAQD